MQRAKFISSRYGCLCCLCRCESVVGNRNDRIDLWIRVLDPVEMRLHNFDRRDVAIANQFGQLGCIGVRQSVFIVYPLYLPLGRLY